MSASEARGRYKHYLAIPTRWMDNDVYGHVNNVVYYSYFDTVINEYLIRVGELDIHQGPIIGLCVESFCQFKKPLEFPQVIEAGLRVGKLGRTSVRYEIGLFVKGEAEPAAEGHFVHVFVGRDGRTATPIPEPIRSALAMLVIESLREA
jgi:acyl-CoA thioester hydrolase